MLTARSDKGFSSTSLIPRLDARARRERVTRPLIRKTGKVTPRLRSRSTSSSPSISGMR